MELKEQFKPLLLGDTAPDFSADSTIGPIHFHEWIGDSWCLFSSHPKDFTPVCTSELIHIAKINKKFEERNVKTLCMSVDSLDSHEQWMSDVKKIGNTPVDFPIIADPDRKISHLYGLVHPSSKETFTVRSIFLIDPQKKIRFMMSYPVTTGRNFKEVLRVIDSIQLADSYQVITPAEWEKGEDCILPADLQDPEEIKEKFPKGVKVVNPYFRTTPDPENTD